MGLSLQKNKTLATCYNEHVTRCSRKYEKVSWPRVINTRLQLATCIIDTWLKYSKKINLLKNYYYFF
jgi:hypothetical protein